MNEVNEGPDLALQVKMDMWKACIVPFPSAAVFSHWAFV